MGAEPGLRVDRVDAAGRIPPNGSNGSRTASRPRRRRFGVKIAGGNLARGPLNISVSVHGHCARRGAYARRRARSDLVCVSGVFGGAAAALERATSRRRPDTRRCSRRRRAIRNYPLRRYYLPEPRLALGRALRGLATAAIDVSDGLVADLGHLCAASGVAGAIDLDAVPVVAGCTAAQAASGGDDYELCFTIAPQDRARLSGLPERVVGDRQDRCRQRCVVARRRSRGSLPHGGFRHFR